ncbi:MAG TPA: CheR family methyltransferase [Noviherbaspirillum sp.]|nr:CheR family methyltransferase [Noviherbaspirillum sp.]
MTVEQLRRMLQQATGLDLPPDAVESAVRKRMKQRHVQDLSVFVAEAARNKGEFDSLIDLVVVPETWFFRDPEAFSVAARFARDHFTATARPVRILSAPCASGEEPYSLAMALRSVGMAEDSFIIDALDISPQVIRRAQHGVYKRNAFRTVDLGFRDRYFTRHGEGFELAPDIRKLVRFRCGNLLTLIPQDGKAYNIIFCRNLLIYFNEQTQSVAMRKLRALLDDDGLLFCGYAETTTFCLNGFARAPYSNAFAVQKKTSGTSQRANYSGLPFLHRRPMPVTGMPALPRPVAAIQLATTAREAPEALLEQANRAADEGAIDEARRAYRAYLELVPDSAEAHFMLGLLSEQRNDDKDAAEFLRRAVYLDPNHYEALCHLALLAERQGNKAKARTYRHRAARVFERRSGENEE